MPGCGLQLVLQERSPPAFSLLWSLQLERGLQEHLGERKEETSLLWFPALVEQRLNLHCLKGVVEAAKDIGSSCAGCGKAETVLKYLPVTQGMQDMGCAFACWNSHWCMPGTMAQCVTRNLWKLFVDVAMARTIEFLHPAGHLLDSYL